MRTRWVLPTILCLLGFAVSAPAQAAPQDAEGRALVEKLCTKCHKLTGTLSQRNSKERWAAIVDDMVAKGAEATDAEIESIVDYLAKNYGGKIYINRATADELAAELDLPKNGATAIVEYRRKNGSFKGLDDLKKVPSIDWKLIASKQARLDFAENK